MQPTPLPKSELQTADDERVVATAVINPSILLVEVGESLKVLLSRDTLIESQAIHLRGARLIEIPLGWRMRLIRFASRFFKVRLPDEWEFTALRVDTSQIPSPVTGGKRVVIHVMDPELVVPLTGPQYWSLCLMNGRTLHCWIANRFKLAGGLLGAAQPMRRGRAA